MSPAAHPIVLPSISLLLLLHLQAAPVLRYQADPAGPSGGVQLLHFQRPDNAPVRGVLRWPNGNSAPFGSDATGSAWALLREGTYPDGPVTMEAGSASLTAVSEVVIESSDADRALRVSVGGKPVLQYQANPGPLPRPDVDPIYRRGGYIHPVWSPSGRVISDDFPPNHVHHHGIWAPWTKTSFEGREPDFWNMGQGSGRVDFVRVDATVPGPWIGTLRTRHRFIDMRSQPEKAVLEEQWETTVLGVTGARDRECRIFDLSILQTCSTTNALVLPKYHYGGLGFRGHRAWDGSAHCRFLTSNGETNRVAGNETRGNWCWMGGILEGALHGIVILCHPDNFRAPQPMRLHPTEPFFCYAPSQAGDWAIVPGSPYTAKYRFVVVDGEPDRDWMDQLWRDFAHPGRLRVSEE